MYREVQYNLRFTRQDLAPHIVEELTQSQGKQFRTKEEVYTVLDCGLFGPNWERKHLHPFLKIWKEESYVRADAHCDMVFKSSE